MKLIVYNKNSVFYDNQNKPIVNFGKNKFTIIPYDSSHNSPNHSDPNIESQKSDQKLVIRPFEFLIGSLQLQTCETIFYCINSQKIGTFLGNNIKSTRVIGKYDFPTNEDNIIDKNDSLISQLVFDSINHRKLLFCENDNTESNWLFQTVQSNILERNQTENSLKKNNDYIWNWSLLSRLKKIHLESSGKQLMNGFFGQFENKETEETISLITRRSWKRDGMRLVCRGSDLEGNTANFAVTELIITRKKENLTRIRSIVILRGSMPFFWKQNRDLSYKPPIKVNEDPFSSMEVFEKHFKNLFNVCGKQIVVNLVNQSGRESVLEKIYKDLVTEHNTLNSLKRNQNSSTNNYQNDIDYIAFDFHKECRNLSIKNLSKLLQRLFQSMSYMVFEGYIDHTNRKYISNKLQTIFCRVNCMDNLDRTNLVESVIIGEILKTQYDSNLFQTSNYKHMWADNGDIISMQYAGTPALKSDWTRTGKRSLVGLLNDAYHSLKRYHLNNFRDGSLQDGLNIALGKFDPKELREILVKEEKEEKGNDFSVIMGSTMFLLSFVSIQLISYLCPKEIKIRNWGNIMISLAVGLYCGYNLKIRVNRSKTEGQ